MCNVIARISKIGQSFPVKLMPARWGIQKIYVEIVSMILYSSEITRRGSTQLLSMAVFCVKKKDDSGEREKELYYAVYISQISVTYHE